MAQLTCANKGDRNIQTLIATEDTMLSDSEASSDCE